MLAMSACALCLSSCGDDDDEGNDVGGADSVYTGSWIMSHMKITEDGESESGKVDPSLLLVKMQLNDDNTFTYYAYTAPEGDMPAEVVNQEGNWNYKDNVLTLNMKDGSVAKMQVKRWTNKEWVTYQSEGGYSETRTWKRG